MRPSIYLNSVIMFTISMTSAVEAQLPADQTVQLRFHQTPSDANSPVDFYVLATLEAVEIDGNAIGWAVASMEFFQDDGNETKSWVETYPTLDTSDGLWWVNHDDPQSPLVEEFLTTPLLQGTAAADDPADEDLSYEILSIEAAPSSPYEKTASVTYAMAAADTNEPVKEGEDEPVESHDTRDMD